MTHAFRHKNDNWVQSEATLLGITLEEEYADILERLEVQPSDSSRPHAKPA